MPRPKRTKVASSIPAARGAKPSSGPKATKHVVEDISDEGEGVTTNTRRVSRSNVRNIGAAEDVQMRAKSARIPGAQNVPALEGARRRRDAAMERLEAENLNTTSQTPTMSEEVSSSPSIETGRRASAIPSVENSVLAFGNFRRRARQPSILGRGEPKVRSSSVESDLAESNGLTSARPMENSALLTGNFRRRQREPSILGRGNSRVRSSSLGLEMDVNTPGVSSSALRTGMFRRRQRQPSILGTGKKNQERGSDYESDGADDFNPEDESTPLNLKTRSGTEQVSQSTSSTTNPRKRKLSSRHAPVSSPPSPAEESEPAATDPTTSLSRPSPVPQTARPTTPEPFSDTMAPPRSSSSPPALPEVPPPSRRPNLQPARPRGRQPTRQPLAPPLDDDLPSSPPSLTHSPNRPTVTRPSKPKPQPATLPTAQLQALLPRRRRRPARGTFDVESSSEEEVVLEGLGSDDDELTHATIRTNRTTRSAAPRAIARLKPGAKLDAKSQAGINTGKQTRTTRLNSASDKENHRDEADENSEFEVPGEREGEEGLVNDSLGPLPEVELSSENSQELEERIGRELKRAKRKFEVVDAWELEFEDVTVGSSSGVEWR